MFFFSTHFLFFRVVYFVAGLSVFVCSHSFLAKELDVNGSSAPVKECATKLQIQSELFLAPTVKNHRKTIAKWEKTMGKP